MSISLNFISQINLALALLMHISIILFHILILKKMIVVMKMYEWASLDD